MRVRSAVASALLLVACQDPPKPAPPDASPPPPPPPSQTQTAASHPPVPPPIGDAGAPKKIACRILSGEGEGTPAPSADPATWLDLGPKARITVRMNETGKEVRFEGPGKVRACGGEVALVADGTVIGLPSGGDAPGSEQWVATPCAVARWSGGVHKMINEKDGCTLQSSAGTSWLWIPEGARIEDAPLDGGAPDAGLPESEGGWRRIDARRAIRIRSGAPAPVPAVLACEKAVSDVDAIAAKMADGGPLGDLAATSIVARRWARAACALAAVRTSGLAKPDPALEARVTKAISRL